LTEGDGEGDSRRSSTDETAVRVTRLTYIGFDKTSEKKRKGLNLQGQAGFAQVFQEKHQGKYKKNQKTEERKGEKK